MCDYSLEMYSNRKAVAGEDLVARKFPSGSTGFVSESNPDCAVCCESGVEMTLHLDGVFETRALDGSGSETENFSGETLVAFFTLNAPRVDASGYGRMYFYRDGLITPSGRFLSMQNVPHGTRATVTKALPSELIEAAKGTVAFEPEVKIEEPTAPTPVEAVL